MNRYLVFSLLLMGGCASNNASVQDPADASGKVANLMTTQSAVINGPTFQDVDARMDTRISKWTKAQKDAYWASVQGTRIQWMGEVREIDSKATGLLQIKCNPKSYFADTWVTLDGTQLDTLANYNKGQQLRFSGVLSAHSFTGYTILNGHID
jgi:hypothetical protein